MDRAASRRSLPEGFERKAGFPSLWPTGYYLDSPADSQKIKALVAMYFVANALFQALGSTSSIVITLGATSDRSGSLANRLEFGFIRYIISAFTFQWQATSSARLAVCWPRTSLKSTRNFCDSSSNRSPSTFNGTIPFPEFTK